MIREKIDILILQGTRWPITHTLTINNHKIFNNPSPQDKSTLGYSGTTIIISPQILPTTIKQIIVQPARILALRIKTTDLDIQVISAHAPGEHLSNKEREEFWHNMHKFINNLPMRTSTIIGIYANGHSEQASHNPNRTNENGKRLNRLTQDHNLIITNNQKNCQHPGYTWNTRDSKHKTKIDYLIIDNRATINLNQGADYHSQLPRQGQPPDHFPVKAQITIPNQKLKHTTRTYQFDRNRINEILKAQEADRTNQQLKQPNINSAQTVTESQYIHQVIQQERLDMIPDETDIDTHWKLIQDTMTEAFQATPAKQKRTQPWATNPMILKSQQVHKAWHDTKQIWNQVKLPNWNREIKDAIQAAKQQKLDEDQS
jgi:hypothetical protein